MYKNTVSFCLHSVVSKAYRSFSEGDCRVFKVELCCFEGRYLLLLQECHLQAFGYLLHRSFVGLSTGYITTVTQLFILGHSLNWMFFGVWC